MIIMWTWFSYERCKTNSTSLPGSLKPRQMLTNAPKLNYGEIEIDVSLEDVQMM